MSEAKFKEVKKGSGARGEMYIDAKQAGLEKLREQNKALIEDADKMAQELLTIRRQLIVATHLSGKTAEEFDWNVLDRIHELEQQNKELKR